MTQIQSVVNYTNLTSQTSVQNSYVASTGFSFLSTTARTKHLLVLCNVKT